LDKKLSIRTFLSCWVGSGNEIEYRETDEKSRDVFKRNNSESKISHTETISDTNSKNTTVSQNNPTKKYKHGPKVFHHPSK
jgi:hypothetical protein